VQSSCDKKYLLPSEQISELYYCLVSVYCVSLNLNDDHDDDDDRNYGCTAYLF